MRQDQDLALYSRSVFGGCFCCCKWEQGHCSSETDSGRSLWSGSSKMNSLRVLFEKGIRECLSFEIVLNLIQWQHNLSKTAVTIVIHCSTWTVFDDNVFLTLFSHAVFVLVLQVLAVRLVSGSGGLHDCPGSVPQKSLWRSAGPAQMQVGEQPDPHANAVLSSSLLWPTWICAFVDKCN